jgi:hypothetical protein
MLKVTKGTDEELVVVFVFILFLDWVGWLAGNGICGVLKD